MNGEQLARYCIDYAISKGASAVRVTLTHSLMNLVGILNSEVDKVTSSLDRSLQFQLFAFGKYGTFSTNRLEKEELERFLDSALDMVKMLEDDPLRALPSPERKEKGAISGEELGLFDHSIESVTPESRRQIALESSIWAMKGEFENGFTLIAEEGEYSDTVYDSIVMDSDGLYARHRETSFEIGYECTVEDREGVRYSAYWWDAAEKASALDVKGCAAKALRLAAEQLNPREIESGKYTLVVDTECASRLLNPILSSLGGFALQQKNSFLEGSIGKQVFPSCLNVIDSPRVPGATGSRLFDSEGVATKEDSIIENGVVKKYFLNTYMAAKMGLEPTVEDATRVVVKPTGDACNTVEDLLQSVGDCIYVTGFNGGNFTPSTGNFSYGIEGFLYRGGKRICPVKEALMTGDFISLWNGLFATARDVRPCMSKKIPSLAFKNVDVSA